MDKFQASQAAGQHPYGKMAPGLLKGSPMSLFSCSWNFLGAWESTAL